jgi:NACHT conflict system protein/AAA domain-containing protein
LEPPITYRGALQLLGKHDAAWLHTLDGALGGAILSSVAVTPIAAVFGWIDQKNEAMSLLQKGLRAARGRLLRTRSFERQQLVTAAHTIIVLISFFDAFKIKYGSKAYVLLEITDEEKLALVKSDNELIDHLRTIDKLYCADVPMPSAVQGLVETLLLMRIYYSDLANSTLQFAAGLSVGEHGPPASNARFVESIVEAALQGYEANYVSLASEVAEFRMYAELREFAATRNEIRSAVSELKVSLNELRMRILDRTPSNQVSRSASFSGLEQLLRSISPPASDRSRSLEVLERLNRSALKEAILPPEIASNTEGLRIPLVSEIYVTPSFKASTYTQGSRPSDERWWLSMLKRDDIDLFFATYFASSASTKTPMLVLGHPGAGKSMLTKILAARLPQDSYIAVRVPLRSVSADMSLGHQIQEAVSRATNNRTTWREINEASGCRTRVVLLDGLDELLQASDLDHADYLQEIVRFQQVEASQEEPVAVIITTRTVVADRVRIPDGTPIVHLEEFDHAQVGLWLRKWEGANATVGTEKRRHLSSELVLQLGELARQPLLLLMLTIYHSDSNTSGLTLPMSTAELYRRLIDHFVDREVRKRPNLRQREIESKRSEQIWRLAVTAFAMFNRGRQHITDEEIGADILGLTSRPSTTHMERVRIGQEAVGRFFFVHSAQANFERGSYTRRSYEFLHATFGEFLVAQLVTNLLVQLGASRRNADSVGGVVDDRMLSTLLCHRPLAIRSSILSFVEELLPKATPELASVGLAIEDLLRALRTRPSDQVYRGYRPSSDDYLRRLAVYSANLVLLRVKLTSASGVELYRIIPGLDDWHSWVRLWWSGLDGDGWAAQVQALDFDNETKIVSQRVGRYFDANQPEIGYAQLIGDRHLERVLRAGYQEISGRNFDGGSPR